MADIHVMGHGSWETARSSRPFVTVPANTSVVFYTPMGRLINSHLTVEIVRNSPRKLPVDREIGGVGV